MLLSSKISLENLFSAVNGGEHYENCFRAGCGGVHTITPSIWEVEAGGCLSIQGQSGLWRGFPGEPEVQTRKALLENKPTKPKQNCFSLECLK